MKSRLMLSAAIVAVAAAAVGLSGCSGSASAKAWGPNKVAQELKDHKFKIDDMKRKGGKYIVIATGPKGNKVEFLVDGAHDGKIIGMDVIEWVPGAKRVTRGSHGTDFFDEFYEFGTVVSAAEYATWTDYSEEQWESTEASSEEITLTSEESSEEVTTEDVSYEENVQEVDEATAEEETTEASTDESSSEEGAAEDTSGSDDSASGGDDASGGDSGDSGGGGDDGN